MTTRHRLCAALLGLGALLSSPAPAADPEARVIVKLKAASPLKQAQAAGRVQSLGARLGVSARLLGQPAPDLQVMQASGISSEALAARLAQQADVEYAVPDRIKTIRALPNDPLLGNQWYLQAPGITQPAAIDAVGAWNLTGGSSSVVVAVVDTGVRFDHEDLATPLLAGYDFVADDLNSGDGQAGRDADASDPGDYLSSADLSNATLRNMCGTSATHASSWHGTQVAGIVAAQAGNGLGIAGVGGATRVLPVRVLGKCGGFDSDIIAGMRWAAGLTVPGVPANPNPARVINLSLAGGSGCSSAYSSAIAEIRQAGALIVAAAGNETSPVEEPASCPGVLAVAGIRHAGTKVGYSSGAGMLNAAAAVSLALGPLVDIGVSGSTVSGSTLTLTADSSATLVSWQWAQISGPASGSFGSASSATTTFTPPVAGSYQIRLTVTDSNGRSISTDSFLSVTAPPSSGGGGGSTDPISLAALLALALLAACRRLRR